MDLNVTSNISIVISNILNKYFVNLYSIVVLYDWPVQSETNQEYLNALESIFKSSSSLNEPFIVQWMRIEDLLIDHNKEKFINDLINNIELGCQGYITIMKNMDLFLEVKYDIQQISTQRIKDKHFLFLTDTEEDTILLQNSILQLYPGHLLVTKTTENTLEMYTQPFADDIDIPLLLDTFALNQTFFNDSVDLYFDKMQNLHGKTLKISTVTYVPYSITEFVPEGTGQFDHLNSSDKKDIFYDGTEARIVIEFCRLRNCTIKILPFPGDFWGTIKNGTGTGQIGAVYKNDVELAIGCLYSWYFDIIDYSQSIAKSGVTILVPSAVPVSYALTPIIPFEKSTWLFLLSTMVICMVLYYYVKVFSEILSHKNTVANLSTIKRADLKSSFRKTILEVISVFLQQSFDQGTKHCAVRMVYAVLLFSGITLENTYSGGLKSILTIPRFTSKIETVHDFVLLNLKWGAPQIQWVLTITHANVPDDVAMSKRFEIADEDYLRKMTFSRKYGIGVERLHAGNYAFGDYIQNDALPYLDMLKEDIYFEYTSAYTIRGWPLMEYFNKVAMEVTQHGLFHRWETEIVDRYLDLPTEEGLLRLAAGFTDNPGPETLRIQHIYGPLVMLAVGLSAASVAFVLEHLWQYYEERKNNEVLLLN